MGKGLSDRARGCLLGQLCGDALGSLVEFQAPEEIRRRYPDGVREMADGGAWNTLAGQPTDDSEMALALARLLVEKGSYDSVAARAAYLGWLESKPFDCGNTVAAGLKGMPIGGSQANGALMRISPLGIFGAGQTPERLAEWAREDAGLTHPHPVCRDVNALFAAGLAQAVKTGAGPDEIYDFIATMAREWDADTSVLDIISNSRYSPPAEYVRQQGWVLIAFGNALWQLLHAADSESGIVDTIMRGGDTDTNAAICGALLGAVHGEHSLPRNWRRTVLRCRPESGRSGVYRPRPREYWPIDAKELALALARAGASENESWKVGKKETGIR
ncbi:MAG: ADP-ribosylglycohydrolase family protein [Acidobacteriota bacterium]|jgi:ADP-ribosylglycohydrolase|nr:ADP-ribosylglycohydrolase family protein [Acidobacteriota bacterium]